ncbi:2-deoxy-scyllo-inosose synthase [Nocardia salmonicida]|uniref:2-deoxy-scyllo-inosose synthase n=1 Tax=Nocardia salmonicida TaxID=53431 RepID=UPI0037A141DF
MEEIAIHIGDSGFPYYFGSDCVDDIAEHLVRMDADRFIIVTDDIVMELYGESVLAAISEIAPITLLTHSPGEEMKRLSCLAEHIEQALADGVTRKSIVVSFGGGVPGNLAGLMASLIFRGIRLVHIPTTTIAAMDSVLSLKQAINSGVGKNHIGAYYAPQSVLVDVDMFGSLPDKELRSGLCEMAKNCLAIAPQSIDGLRRALLDGQLSSPSTLAWLLKESVAAKSSVTIGDTYERGSGLVLEYGHTVGHAIELLDHRRQGAAGLSHGESIALGMLVAANISNARGLLSDAELVIHENLIDALGVSAQALECFSVEDIVNVVRDDNKRGYLPSAPGTTPFVLLEKLGSPVMSAGLPLVPVSFEEIRAGIRAAVRSKYSTDALDDSARLVH